MADPEKGTVVGRERSARSREAPAEIQPHPRVQPPAPPPSQSGRVERLRELVADEPFVTELEGRCAARSRERAILVDSGRLCERTLVWMVRRAKERDPRTLGEDWCVKRIDEALRDLVLEDRETLASGVLPEDAADSPYSFLTRAFAIEGRRAPGAVVRFNGQPSAVRQAFFALVVVHRTIEDCVASGLGSRPQLIQRLRQALEALLVDPELDSHEGGAP